MGKGTLGGRLSVVGSGLVVIILIGGCTKPMGEIQGRVTFRGQPIESGVVGWISADGRAVSATIAQGSYRLAKVPLGSAKIAVFSFPPAETFEPLHDRPNDGKGAPASTAPPATRPFTPIPTRYQDHNQSGLTHEVTKGLQTKDIALE